MSQIATGPYKKLAIKKQAVQGTIAAGGAATGEYVRRVTSNIDLKKAQYKSAEITASMQRKDSRHGVRSISGTITGELSSGGYQDFMESVLRQLVVAPATTSALTTIVAAAINTAGQVGGTFTRATGSYITDGFKLGDVVRHTGWVAPAAANNAHNFQIITLTALVMTVISLDGVAVTAKAAGDPVVIAQVGKKTFVPQTGHTRDYYTIEHFFGDLNPVQSERFVDCVVGGFTIRLPATGMATIEFPIMGLDMQTAAAAYFTSPASAPNGGLFAAVNGAIIINGVKVATVTGAEVTVTGNNSAPGGVLGSNIDPDIFPGIVDCSGSLSMLLDSMTFRDLFTNETECQVFFALTTSNAPNADVIVISMPSVKFGGADKDDGEKGITMTLPFIASEQTAGGAASVYLPTTISVQDSLFA